MRKLGVNNKHRRSMLANLSKSLLENGYIITTKTRAKEVSRITEKLITKGKKGDLMSRRSVIGYLHNDKLIADKVFSELAPKYKDRNGGYTRIYSLDERRGDGAQMARIELV
ncbi:MAG: 50S ribosomal protein L17 [Bacilli bacterium]